MILRVDTSPAWARPGRPKLETPPADFEDYADFVGRLADRYRGRVRYYQIWNEPNIPFEWGDEAPDPVAYTHLLWLASQRIHAVDPGAAVISAAMAPTTEFSEHGINELRYLQAMYDAGARGSFDILGANAYGLRSGPDDRRLALDRDVNFSRPVLVRRLMVRNGDAGRPIWAAEVGWSAVPDGSGIPDLWGRVDRETQAAYSARAFARAQREWPWMGVMSLWHFRLVGPNVRALPQYYFNAVDDDFQPLPLYEAMRELTHRPRAMQRGYRQEDDWNLTYSGGWLARRSPEAVLGGYREAVGPAALSLAFEGTDLALVVDRLPGGGALEARVDGLPAVELSLDAAREEWGRRLPVASGLADGWHILEARTRDARPVRLDGVIVDRRRGWPGLTAGQRCCSRSACWSAWSRSCAAWPPRRGGARRALRAEPPTGPGAGRSSRPCAGAALLVGWALRLYHLGWQSFWYDEGTSITVAPRDLPTILANAAADIHPPLYYLLLHVWVGLSGSSEYAARLPSAILGTLLIAVLFRLGRDLLGAAGRRGRGAAGRRRAAADLVQPGSAHVRARDHARRRRDDAARPRADPAGRRPLARLRGRDRGDALQPLLRGRGAARARAGRRPVDARLAASAGRGRAALRGRRRAGRRVLPALDRAHVRPADRLAGDERAVRAGRPGRPDAAAVRARLRGRAARRQPGAAGRAGGRARAGLAGLAPPRGRAAGRRLPARPAGDDDVRLALAPVLPLEVRPAGRAGGRARARRGGAGARRRRSRRLARRRAAAPAAVALAVALASLYRAEGLRAQYFDPRLARDDYRGLARAIASGGQPGDAIVLDAPGQVELFDFYYRGEAPRYPLPSDAAARRGARPTPASRRWRRDTRASGCCSGPIGRPTRPGWSRRWLDERMYKSSSRWWGGVRAALYVNPQVADVKPQRFEVGARFGDLGELAAVEVVGLGARAGEAVPVSLEWRASEPADARYTAFVHLIDDEEYLWGQHDSEPVGGARPTTAWRAGETIADRHGVPVAVGTPPRPLPARGRALPGRHRRAACPSPAAATGCWSGRSTCSRGAPTRRRRCGSRPTRASARPGWPGATCTRSAATRPRPSSGAASWRC